MRIDPDTEKATRDLLSHAIRGELEEMGTLVETMGEERYLQCITLCVFIAGYIGIDVPERWPTDADLREIARHAAETTKEFELDKSAVFEFLSRVVFGSEQLTAVFPDLAVAGSLPVLATARIIVSFRPHELRGKYWWDYLDVIEGATEAAMTVDPALLPALMFRTRKEQSEPVAR
jgi:hypothetical protein